MLRSTPQHYEGSARMSGDQGFSMTFTNGLTVSVQFGAMNYCDNRYGGGKAELRPCPNAEVAVLWPEDHPGTDGHFYPITFGDDVVANLPTDCVATLIARTMSVPYALARSAGEVRTDEVDPFGLMAGLGGSRDDA